MSATIPPRLLSPAEVADYLGVSTRQLYRWRNEGRGPSYLKLGRQIRYHPDHVRAYLRTHHTTTRRREGGA